jgi:hypothetical protein
MIFLLSRASIVKICIAQTWRSLSNIVLLSVWIIVIFVLVLAEDAENRREEVTRSDSKMRKGRRWSVGIEELDIARAGDPI